VEPGLYEYRAVERFVTQRWRLLILALPIIIFTALVGRFLFHDGSSECPGLDSLWSVAADDARRMARCGIYGLRIISGEQRSAEHYLDANPVYLVYISDTDTGLGSVPSRRRGEWRLGEHLPDGSGRKRGAGAE
jgi:hypothetical protein